MAILILIAKNSINNASSTDFPNNKLPMYGAKDYKDYVTRRSEDVKKEDEYFIEGVLKLKTKEEGVKEMIFHILHLKIVK